MSTTEEEQAGAVIITRATTEEEATGGAPPSAVVATTTTSSSSMPAAHRDVDDSNGNGNALANDDRRRQEGNNNNDGVVDGDERSSNKRKRGQQRQEQRQEQRERPKRTRSQRKRKASSKRYTSNDGVAIESRVVPLEYPPFVQEAEQDGEVSGGDGTNDAAACDAPTKRWIRIVSPYPYSYSTHAKARWIGRSVLDVYADEFGSYPRSYYESSIRQGRILVNGGAVDPSYTVRAQDELTHAVHRHEPAVAVASDRSPYAAKIVADTDSLLVVDKPPALPVHPCGGYHDNSLLNVLQKELGKAAAAATTAQQQPRDDGQCPPKKKLYMIHRLDRLTSGLVVLGKDSAAAKQWGTLIQERECEKLYLARARGRFPKDAAETLPRLGGDGSTPIDGKWQSSKAEGQTARKDKNKNGKNNKDDDETAAADKMRKTYAYGYWITDGQEKLRPDVSIEQYLSAEPRAVEEWLQVQDARLESDVGTGKDKFDESLFYWFNFACPTRIEQPKIGVCKADAFDDLDAATYCRTVKPAETSFAVVRYDEASDSTVLLCRPRTGRTHQIRIHLQHLGHCIANDPNYGGDMWFANPRGRAACRAAQAILDSIEQEQKSIGDSSDQSDGASSKPSSGLVTSDVPMTDTEFDQLSQMQRSNGEPMEQFIRRSCVWCARNRSGRQDRAILEFLVRSPGIWLHALQYSVRAGGIDGKQRTTFRTPDLPEWCAPTERDEG